MRKTVHGASGKGFIASPHVRITHTHTMYNTPLWQQKHISLLLYIMKTEDKHIPCLQEREDEDEEQRDEEEEVHCCCCI